MAPALNNLELGTFDAFGGVAAGFGFDQDVGVAMEDERRFIDHSIIDRRFVDHSIIDRRCVDEAARQVYCDQLAKVRDAARSMGQTGMPVERVVRAVRHALLARRPKTRYPVGFRTRLAIWAYWNLPNRWFDWFMANAMGLT